MMRRCSTTLAAVGAISWGSRQFITSSDRGQRTARIRLLIVMECFVGARQHMLPVCFLLVALLGPLAECLLIDLEGYYSCLDRPYLEEGVYQPYCDSFGGALCTSQRFTPLAEIARGKYSSVWSAKDEVSKRKVALKKFSRHGKAKPQLIRHEECLVASMSRELPVPEMYCAYNAEMEIVLVMELVEGDRLDHLIADHHPSMVANYVMPVIRGLNSLLGAFSAHALLHRDIKPENIIIRKGEAVFVDFGYSGPRDRLAHYMLTPAYGAPEIIQRFLGGGASPFEWSPYENVDFYSMGVTIWEMLEGSLSFISDGGSDGGNECPDHAGGECLTPDEATRGMVRKCHRVHLGLCLENLPRYPQYQELLTGLLDRDPGRRWGTIEVRKWVQRQPSGFRQPSELEPRTHRRCTSS